MESAAFLSPSSDEHFWINLSDRVDAILEDRKPNHSTCDAESKHGSRFREDSLLLIKGLDSVSSSLSQLTDALGAAKQGLNDLEKPALQKSQKRESQRTSDEEDEQRKTKKHCSPNLAQAVQDSKEEATSNDHKEDLEDDQNSTDVSKSVNLKKAKNLAMSMVSKASSLAKELKMIRAELNFMQERCTLLEEENRRFRDGFEKGAVPDEDDLVRLQLEALLAEKSRLASENANLTRENQCLYQLVEYHQLTLENLSSSSYEEEIEGGMQLDFLSPERKANSESEEEIEGIQLDFSSSERKSISHENLNGGNELSENSNLTSPDEESNEEENRAAAA